MTLPKFGTAGKEAVGVSIVGETVARPQAEGGLGFIFRPQPSADVGIDGHIEVIDQLSTEATGKILGVQVKAGPSFFKQELEDGWTVPISKRTVHYWRQYSVPVILVIVDTATRTSYWALVSSGTFGETKTKFKIPVRKDQRLDATAARTIQQLAASPSPELAEQLREIVQQLSASTASELERHLASWREGRRTATRAWLDELARMPSRLRAIDPGVAARVLRFAAAVSLDFDDDVEKSRSQLLEARQMDPGGTDVYLQAALLARVGELIPALDLLNEAPDLNSQRMRISLLLTLNRVSEAEVALDAYTPAQDHDVAEGWRLRAMARLAAGDMTGAKAAVDRANESATRSSLQVRWTEAALAYYSGHIADAIPRHLPRWPEPVAEYFLRSDAPALSSFRRAADGFREILEADLSPRDRRSAQTWRLAALSAVPAERAKAEEFARETLARDPTHPSVLLWAAHLDLQSDFAPNFAALLEELRCTNDVSLAAIYVRASIAANRVGDLASWIDAWRTRFEDEQQVTEWLELRALALLADGEVDQARAMLPDLDRSARLAIETKILWADALQRGDERSFLAHLEGATAQTGDPGYLLQACLNRAQAGDWSYVAQHVDYLLERIPTPSVRRLAIFARFHTADFAGCVRLIEPALVHGEESDESMELRRLRAQAHANLGRVVEAIDDMTKVAAHFGIHVSKTDLLFLARLHFFAGNSHELASCARQLRSRDDLRSDDALMLAELLTNDDPPLARDLWHIADARGVTDESVLSAVLLGYKLSLDAHLRQLGARMMMQAEAGSSMVRAYTVDELISIRRDWPKHRDHILDLYARGDTATHVVAQFLNEPLVHFYHVIPSDNRRGPMMRQTFALQLRDGGRTAPGADSDLVFPRRIALDLSALLLAHDLEILPLAEASFAPIRLPHAVIAALQEQRGQLRPHQPSRMEINRKLLDAERLGWLETWEGELPNLRAREVEAAGAWTEWVALLEHAKQEGAFVVDISVDPNSPRDRPIAVAASGRLERLIPVAHLAQHLREAGVLETAAQGAVGTCQFEESGGAGSGDADRSTSVARPPRGSVLYITPTAAEQMAEAGLVAPASQLYTLKVRASEQNERRAHLDVLPELEDRVAWVEALIRRVSDGLGDGRYELLPARTKSRTAKGATESPPQESSVLTPAAVKQAPGEASSSRSHPAPAEDLADVGTVDEDSAGEGDEKGYDTLPLSLELLRDLLTLPAGTVDGVWIDDRAVNRHRLAGEVRIFDVLEMLVALEAAGSLLKQRRWDLQMQLRAANVRVIPLSADELLHHLLTAPVTDAELIETRSLRILRQYNAALFADARSLRIPSAEERAIGNIGELELVRSYEAAIRAALIQVWREVRDPAHESAITLAQARSQWLLRNMYVDPGLLRARVVHPDDPADLSISAFSAATLFLGALQLLVEPDGLERGQLDDVAARYAAWVDRHIVSPRARHEPGFQRALVDHLRRLLRLWPTPEVDCPAISAASRILSGRLYDALPEKWRIELAADDELMAFICRAVVPALNLGHWDVAPDAFALAAAAAMQFGEAEVPVLDTEPPLMLSLAADDAGTLTLKSPDGAESIVIQDSIFGVLSPDEEVRRAAYRAARVHADISTEEWERTTEPLIQIQDPVRQLKVVLEHRETALPHRYTRMRSRWLEDGRIDAEDLSPPAAETVLAHLRLVDVPVSESDWNRAASTLIAEAGLETAIERFSGVPVPIPAPIVAGVSGLSPEETRSLLLGVLRNPTSPVATFNVLRLLALIGEDDPLYYRLAHRLIRLVTSESWHTSFGLQHAVLKAALASQSEPPRKLQMAEANVERPNFPGALLSAWYHSHQFVRAVGRTGGNISAILTHVEQLVSGRTDRLFSDVVGDRNDIAHPLSLARSRFLVAGLQYGCAGTGILAEPSSFSKPLLASLRRESSEGPVPHMDLLRDTSSRRNRLGTWLSLARQRDGSVSLGPFVVVPSSLAPAALRSQALDSLASDPLAIDGWVALAVTDGSDPLSGPDAEKFDAALVTVDVPMLLRALDSHAPLGARRIASQAVGSGNRLRRQRLREELLASVREERGRTRRDGSQLTKDDLSELQLAVLDALYLLARAEGGSVDAMAVFARDMSALGRADPRYLRRARVVIEYLVQERSLPEAHALTGLLFDARGV